MDLDAAQVLIQSAADALTAQLRAKGYEKAHAEIWIGRGFGERRCVVFIAEAPNVAFIPSCEQLSRVISEAEKAISAVPEQYTTASMAPWFEGAAP